VVRGRHPHSNGWSFANGRSFALGREPARREGSHAAKRWLLPHRLAPYTDLSVQEIAHFTFLPEFVPATVARWLAPIERRLETSSLRCCSAHYMAVLRKRH
jgi:hypothetical protein